MTSQYSTNIQLDTYAAATDKRSKQGGGGWAAAHFANFAFEFTDANNEDLLKEDPKKPVSPENKIFGKRVKVRFKKSTNEKTGMQISYPVKYGVVGQSSVWTAVEVIDVMKMFSLLKIGAWIDFPAQIRNEIIQAIKDRKISTYIDLTVLDNKELKPEEKTAMQAELYEQIEDLVPLKVNGEKKLIQWFDSHPEISNYLANKFKETMVPTVVPIDEEAEDEAKESGF